MIPAKIVAIGVAAMSFLRAARWGAAEDPGNRWRSGKDGRRIGPDAGEPPRRSDDGTPDGERILLVRLSSLGDVLQCLHALADLRASRPAASIHWLVEDRCAAVLAGHPMLDGVLVFERRALMHELRRPWLWPRAALRVGRLRRSLRALRPTVAVDLQGNLKGALLARLSGAPRCIGLASGHGAKELAHRFATESVPLPPPPVHRADRARALLAPLGLRAGSGTAVVAGVAAQGAWAEGRLRAMGIEPGHFAVLHPGTSMHGAAKRWPLDRWAALARELRSRYGLPVLLTTGRGEESLADGVAALSRGAATRAPEDRGLAQLGAILSRAALVVGADTGPVHLAALLGVPTVALYGPKDPAVYAPRGPRVEVVWKQVWCSPCLLRRCDDPVCMEDLRLDEVLPAVDALLSGRRSTVEV